MKQVDVFLEFPSFLYDPVNVGNLISVPLFFLNPAWKVDTLTSYAFLKKESGVVADEGCLYNFLSKRVSFWLLSAPLRIGHMFIIQGFSKSQ